MSKNAKNTAAKNQIANIDQDGNQDVAFTAEFMGCTVDQVPEGWTSEMVEAYIGEAEYQDNLHQLKAKGLAMVTLPKETRETAENYIVPAGLLGTKERWFIKKNLEMHSKAGDSIVIVATVRQLKDRGISL